jgi:hypothetical protein
MLLIGFGNKGRHGKDTAAQAIRDFYEDQNESRLKHLPSWKGSIKVGIFKYAGALYQEVNSWLKVTTQDGLEYSPLAQYVIPPDETNFNTHVQIPEWVKPDPNPEKSELAPYGKHPKLLQWWGTQYRRERNGQDYWIKKLFASMPSNLDIALITDVRFIDEAEAIKQRGGYVVNVQRLNKDGSVFVDPSRPADHPSETQLDNYNFDFYIKNSHGHQALLGEFAITLCEYLRGLQK